MQVDAGGNMIFRSSIGRLHCSLFAVIFLLCVIFFAAAGYCILNGRDSLLFMLIGLTFLFSGIFLIILFRTMRYVLEKDGIRLPKSARIYGWGLQDFIPYGSVTRFYESREITRTLGFSLDQVWIDFRGGHGKKDGVGLSPKDKGIFISELTRRTGLPVSVSPYLKG